MFIENSWDFLFHMNPLSIWITLWTFFRLSLSFLLTSANHLVIGCTFLVIQQSFKPSHTEGNIFRKLKSATGSAQKLNKLWTSWKVSPSWVPPRCLAVVTCFSHRRRSERAPPGRWKTRRIVLFFQIVCSLFFTRAAFPPYTFLHTFAGEGSVFFRRETLQSLSHFSTLPQAEKFAGFSCCSPSGCRGALLCTFFLCIRTV